jgi:hypothetical protein
MLYREYYEAIKPEQPLVRLKHYKERNSSSGSVSNMPQKKAVSRKGARARRKQQRYGISQHLCATSAFAGVSFLLTGSSGISN